MFLDTLSLEKLGFYLKICHNKSELVQDKYFEKTICMKNSTLGMLDYKYDPKLI